MAPQDSVELRAQTFNCTPALMIEEMRSELDGDAIQGLERVLES
jgi:hypothetical protein